MLTKCITRLFACILVLLSGLVFTNSSLGQEAPFGIKELIIQIKSRPLDQARRQVESRGIDFVPTQGILDQIKEVSDRAWPSDTKGYDNLVRALSANLPKVLVVAVAKFRSGSDKDVKELQLTIEHRLKEIGTRETPLRIMPVPSEEEIATDDDAIQVGNNMGVNLVVWGYWQSNIFHPTITVTYSRNHSGLQRQERDYKLDINDIHSGATKASNLVGLLIGLSYYERSEYELAANVLHKISSPDSEIYFHLGNCSYRRGNLQEAEDYFDKAVTADPKSLNALHNKSTVQYYRGKFSEAMSGFRAALEIERHSDVTMNNLGIALAAQGQIEQGLLTIRRALEINPRNANARFNYAAMLYNTDEFSEASDAFEEYLRLRPDDHQVWFFAAKNERLSHVTRGSKIKEFLLKAIEGDPQRGDYLEEFVYAVPVLNYTEDLALYRKFYMQLSSVHFEQGSHPGRLESLRTKIIIRLSWLAVEVGRYTEAHQAVGGLRLSQEAQRDCAKRIVYKMATSETNSQNVMEPLRKKYHSTVLKHFFRQHQMEYPNENENPNDLLTTYEELLRSQKSNSDFLVGKGILQLEILRLSEGALITHGFLKPRLKKPGEEVPAPEWSVQFAREAEQTLQKANAIVTDRTLKHDLSTCIRELRDR